MKTAARKKVSSIFLLLLIPAVVIGGAVLFRDKQYALISLAVAALSCVPVFLRFERRDATSRELMILAILVAISVAGRFVFAWLPGFKPVTAVTVVAALYLGKEAGFLVGALSAVVSNFYFGQGPWTPFQMFAWGIIGFLAGVFAGPLKRRKLLLIVYGVLAGILFSMLMDVWTTLWVDGRFLLSRYLASVALALPFTVEYAVSNVIFLLLLTKPIGEKLERIKTKYGLFTTME